MFNFSQLLEVQFGGPRGRKSGGDKQLSKEEEMELAEISTFTFPFRYIGYKVEPTIHAAAQGHIRRPDMDRDDWKKLHRNVVMTIKDKNLTSGDYVFYSRSMKQAYVANFDTRRRKVRVLTVLPEGRSNPKPGTTRMVTESLQIITIEVE